MGPGGTATCRHCKTLAECSDIGYCDSCQRAGIKALDDMKKFEHYPLGARSTGYNAAILQLTHQALSKMIGLDQDHIISDVIYDDPDRSRRTVRVVIQGPKLYNNCDGCELPWISISELYERIGDPNKITTTLSFENVFTITYKGESFTTEFPLTIDVLGKILTFLANPHNPED